MSRVGSRPTSRCSRLVDRRLDRDERRAQVVRHGGEQRGAQLVGLREVLGGAARLACELAALAPRGAAGRRTTCSTVRSSSADAASPESTSTCSLVAAGCGDRRRPVRSGRARRPTPRRSTPRRRGAAPPPHRGRTRCGAARRAPAAGRRRGERAAERARASRPRRGRAALRPCGGAATSTSTPTTPATTRKTTSASRFSASSIVNVWNGGVKNQLTRPNAQRPRQAAAGNDAAERGDDHHDQQEEQELARERERGSRSCASTSVSASGPATAIDQRGDPAPTRDAGSRRRDRRRPADVRVIRRGALGRDHVHVDRTGRADRPR